MSAKHNKLLLIIAGFEILAVGVLLAWAITHKEVKKQTPPAVTTKPASVQLATSLITTGLSLPTSITSTNQPNDKRLFVTELSGTVRTLNAARQLEAKPFLDISSKVKSEGEMGLLGLAFHPQFQQNGYFYVDYVNKNQESVVARFHVAAKTGLPELSSEKVLLTVKQPYTNHKGGQLQFGPDGFLYIAFGDGGSGGDPGNRAQDKTTLLGKILRIDVDHGDPYSVPASNPFKSDPAAKPEIWAYGLRNPWRFSFDRTEGDLYIADVGQNLIEEIDRQPAGDKGGENYGWRCYEGNQAYNTQGCQPSSHYTAPIITYAHDNKRCSATGGYVYRGQSFSSLKGKYFYADFCTGQIYYAQQRGNSWQGVPVLKTPYAISTFGQDSAGELYVADYTTGSLYRLEAH